MLFRSVTYTAPVTTRLHFCPRGYSCVPEPAKIHPSDIHEEVDDERPAARVTRTVGRCVRNEQAALIIAKYANEDPRHATYDWRQEGAVAGGSPFGDKREEGTVTTTCVKNGNDAARVDDVVFRDESTFRNGGQYKEAYRRPTLKQPFCGMKTRTEEVVCPHMYACVSSDMFVRESKIEIDDRRSQFYPYRSWKRAGLDYSFTYPPSTTYVRLAKQVADAVGAAATAQRAALTDVEAATTWLGQERVCVHKYVAFSMPFKALAYVANHNGDDSLRAWSDLLNVAESHNWIQIVYNILPRDRKSVV